MPQLVRSTRVRYIRLSGWIVFLIAFFYLYFTRSHFVSGGLANATSVSLLFGYLVYFLMGCIRGFTLIPAAQFVLLAVPLFPPMPLFVLTLAGILISSSSIYYFSESLHLYDFFEGKHKARVDQMKQILQRRPALIIIAWSFFPLVPTDLICYVCGVLRIDFRKFIISVFVGEGAICGMYIFLGARLLQILHFHE